MKPARAGSPDIILAEAKQSTLLRHRTQKAMEKCGWQASLLRKWLSTATFTQTPFTVLVRGAYLRHDSLDCDAVWHMRYLTWAGISCLWTLSPHEPFTEPFTAFTAYNIKSLDGHEQII